MVNVAAAWGERLPMRCENPEPESITFVRVTAERFVTTTAGSREQPACVSKAAVTIRTGISFFMHSSKPGKDGFFNR